MRKVIYLLPNFVSNGSGVLTECALLHHQSLQQIHFYVFDSSKGQILERQGAQVEMSYENQDNFEHEVVTVKAVERIQFHVPTVERDAFMKCSDIAAALTAITKP